MKSRVKLKYTPEYKSLRHRLLANSVRLSCGCRLWLGYCNKSGYGEMKVWDKKKKKHRKRYAHHVAMELKGIKLPKGFNKKKVRAHTCHIPSCIETRHLTLKTHRDNIQDSVEQGSHYSLVQRREATHQEFLASLVTEEIQWPYQRPSNRRNR